MALPQHFVPNKFIEKLINDFEIVCPFSCGLRVKQGDLDSHLKNCSQRTYECNECGKMLKKDQFKIHI